MPKPSYIALDNDSLLILLKGKNIVLNKRTAFIVDKTIMDILFKKNITEEEFVNFEVLTNFMNCRDINNEHRQLILLPKCYDETKEKLKETFESLPLFKGHFKSAEEIVGVGENSDEEELLSLAKHLENICNGVIIVSEELHCKEDFCNITSKRTFVTNLENIATILRMIPNFNKYLYDKYYSSSA